MGRTIFSFILCFLLFVTPSLANSQSHVITVSATVLPSPEWINLLRSHSTITHVVLPFLNFDIYRLHLTDGNILIRNQPVSLLINNQVIQSASTDSSGNITFLIPKYITTQSINFSYLSINLL